MRTLARFTIRPNDTKDDLILGGLLKQSKLLTSGKVYEIVDVMGELIIKDVGPTEVKPEYWNSSINTIINNNLAKALITEEEAND